MSHLRDPFSDLLEQLLADQLEDVDSQLDADGDVRAALRLLAHALLNAATTIGPEVIGALRQVTPWLQVFLQRELDEDVAADTDLPAAAGWLEEGKDGERALVERLLQAARDTDKLESLVDVDDAEFADRMLGETRQARIICKAVSHGEPRAVAERARSLFPGLEEAAPQALEMLEKLESGDGSALQDDPAALADQARNFETSLAANMLRQGMAPAVRAALIFGPREGEGLPTYLFAASTFRDQPELAELAGALTANRGRAIRYYRGGAPLAHLQPWVDYLRTDCHELVRRRDVSYREAVSFAHFCFHLMNVCDLARLDGGLTDEVREGVMGVEDELKEFALAGRRENLEEGVTDLASYDERRWAANGVESYLADRLARLAGAWRRESESGPVGAPPQLDDELYDAALDVWEAIDETTRDGLHNGLGCMRLEGLDALEGFDLEQIGRLLALATKYARDLPGLNVTEPFRVDVAELVAAGAGRERLAKRALREILRGETIPEVFGGHWEPETPGGVGLVGEVIADGEAEMPTLQLRLELDAESTALLSLLEDAFDEGTDETPGRLRTELREKVRRHFTEASGGESSTSAA